METRTLTPQQKIAAAEAAVGADLLATASEQLALRGVTDVALALRVAVAAQNIGTEQTGQWSGALFIGAGLLPVIVPRSKAGQ